jgi:hypothetical protein
MSALAEVYLSCIVPRKWSRFRGGRGRSSIGRRRDLVLPEASPRRHDAAHDQANLLRKPSSLDAVAKLKPVCEEASEFAMPIDEKPHLSMIERIERALLLLVYFNELDGDVHVPRFEKFEAELKEPKRRKDTKARARRRLEFYAKAVLLRQIRRRESDPLKILRKAKQPGLVELPVVWRPQWPPPDSPAAASSWRRPAQTIRRVGR